MFTRQFWILFARFAFVFGGIAALVAVHLSLEKNGYYSLHEFEIIIENPIHGSEKYFQSQQAILQIELSHWNGRSLWSLPLHQVEAELGKQSWIESYKIVRIWPNRIQLKLTTGEVSLNFLQSSRKGESQIFPVTKTGRVLGATRAHLAPQAPFLESSKIVKEDELLQKAIRLVEEIPQEGVFSRQRISEIGYKKNDGFWVRLLDSDVQVKMGEGQFTVKSARVAQVLDYVQSRQIDVRVIDANLSKKVLVRLRKDF